MSANEAKPLTLRFINEDSNVRMELSNVTDHMLKTVEVLTVFLKDLETPGGGPSQAHLKFNLIDSIRPKENVPLTFQTWVNGKIAGPECDLTARLTMKAGEVRPYVLDISWQDPDGKTRFQRIPVGH